MAAVAQATPARQDRVAAPTRGQRRDGHRVRPAARGLRPSAVPASGGRPLEAATRTRFEGLYGADLSEVRLHDDAPARRRARGLNARAFTDGSDIHLDPSALGGDRDRVLAHELAHVLQIRLAPSAAQTPTRVAGPRDAVELNASSAADAALAGRPFDLRPAAAGTLYRAVRTECIAPSEILDQAGAARFGAVAEAIIEADYCTKMGCRPFATDFFDTGGWAAPYIAFLAAHNPGLNVPLVAGQVGLSGGVLIPDILTDLPLRREYYEIKPNSIDGRPAGRGKLAAIAAFMHYNSLPYVPGTTYLPTTPIPIPGVGPIVMAILNAPAALACGPPEVALEVVRLMPGLLVYRVCITADFLCYAEAVGLELLIAAAIAAAILAWPVVVAGGAGAGAGAGGLGGLGGLAPVFAF